MKKFALSVVLSLLTVTAFANHNASNGFNDIYNVINGKILSGEVISGPINYQRLNDTAFMLSEVSGTWSGGVVRVSVGQDAAHLCTLTIQDVDFNVPVLVSQSCVGGVGVASFNATYTNSTIVLAYS